MARESTDAVTVISSFPAWATGSLNSPYRGVWFGPVTIAAFIVVLLLARSLEPYMG